MWRVGSHSTDTMTHASCRKVGIAFVSTPTRRTDVRITRTTVRRRPRPPNTMSVVETIRLSEGAWDPHPEPDSEPLLISVQHGLLLRCGPLAGMTSGQLLGPGEIATTRPAPDAFLSQETRWKVLSPASVTMESADEAARSPSWDRISRRLVRSLDEQLARASELIAIGHLQRVEDRVLGLMLHLAGRYGRVAADAIIVPIDLTHQTIGDLVGARRPTVSLALTSLAEAGLLTPHPQAGWSVSPTVPSRLRPATIAAGSDGRNVSHASDATLPLRPFAAGDVDG
jgi:hypothetical protein